MDSTAGQLAPRHRDMLEASSIAEDVWTERGCFTVEKKSELQRLGFGPTLRVVPSLVFPIHGVVPDDPPWYIHRPDVTPTKDGRPRKYLIPQGRKVSLDIHPRVRKGLTNPAFPLFITEGSKKVDALVTAGAEAVAGVLGVWNWRGRNDHDGLAMLPDWEYVALKEGRQVYVVFDSDVMLKEPVRLAMERMGAALKRMGATVAYVYLPSGEGGAKVGADDFLADGHTLADITALAAARLRKPPGTAKEEDGKEYAQVDGAELLGDLREFTRRFAVLPSDEVADLLALWTLHTWTFEGAWATPYLRITSAAPDSGKTLLLEILAELSWSGEKSRVVAEALREWLPRVLREVDPFVSAKDIRAGALWLDKIATELESTDFGIVCVTRENRTAPWLNFEAGAVATGVGGRKNVVPLAIDLPVNGLGFPLAQFQAQELSESGILEVLKSLNAHSTSPLPETDLTELCDVWWPRLAQDLEDRLSAAAPLWRLHALMDETDSLERIIKRAHGRSEHETASARLVEWSNEVEQELEKQDHELCVEFSQTGGPEPQLWDRTSRDDLPDTAWDRQDSKRLFLFLGMKTDVLGSALAKLG